jgi:ferredoxin, 2Fe-2S
MAKITYIQPDDRAQTFDVPAGHSIMEGAFRNNVEGIIAECGGACACGTCQVFIDPAWAERVDKPGPLEQSMIEEVDAGKENLRLSCQISVTDALDGLVVRVPTTQR